MKRKAVVVLSLFLIIFAGLWFAPKFVDWGRYVPHLQSRVLEASGYDLKIGGGVGVSLLPAPHFYAHDVSLNPREGYGSDTFAILERLEVSIALLPLLKGQLAFSVIELDRPVFVIKPDVIKTSVAVDKGAVSAPVDARANGRVSLEKLRIHDGTLTYIDTKTGAQNKVTKLQLSGRMDSLRGPFSGRGSLLYMGQDVAFDVGVGAFTQDAGDFPLNASISLKPMGVQLDYAGIIAARAMEAQGELRVDANLGQAFSVGGARIDALSLRSDVSAKDNHIKLQDLALKLGDDRLSGSANVSIKEQKVHFSVGGDAKSLWHEPVKVQGDFLWGDALALRNGALSLGDMVVLVDARYKGDLARPELDLDIAVEDLNLADLQRPSKTGVSSESNAPFAPDALRSTSKLTVPIDVVLDVGVQKITKDDLVLSGVRLVAALRENNVQISNFSAQDFFGVKLKAQGGVADLKGLKDVALSVEAQGQKIGGHASVELRSADLLQDIEQGKVSVKVGHDHLVRAVKALAPDANLDQVFVLQDKPMTFKALAGGDFDKGSYRFAGIEGDFAGLSMHGDLKFDAAGAHPTLAGDLAFGEVILQAQDKASSGSSRSARGASSASKAHGRWSNDPIEVSWLDTMNLDLALNAQSLKQGKWRLKAPSMNLVMQSGALTVSSLKAGLFGGSIEGGAKLNRASQGIGLSLDAQMNDVDVAALTQALVGNDILKAQGRVSLDANLKSNGVSQAALVSALNGGGQVSGKNLVFTGFDVTQFAEALSSETRPGDTLSGLWRSTSKGGSTQFDTLDGAYVVQNGVIDLQKLDLDGPQALLQTTGQVKLVPWTVATTHKFTLKDRDDVPPFEVRISGSLDKPAQTFAQGALQDYLSRKISRKLEKLLMEKLGREERARGDVESGDSVSPQPDAAQPVTPEEAFRGLLEGLIQ